MNKITLETESYSISGKENERFFPFLELEFNEWVIYENDKPKYYVGLNADVKSEFKINNWLVTELKKGNDLQKLISELGEKYYKSWNIFPSQKGFEVEKSYQAQRIELEILTDKTIERINGSSQTL